MQKVYINLSSVTAKDNSKVILSNIKFTMFKNTIYTIIGKNGCGKSTLIKAITNLLDVKSFEVKGKTLFDETNIFEIPFEELRLLRQKKIQYVFQDAVNSFDPLKKIGYYFNNLSLHKDKIEATLKYFRLPPFDRVSEMYPHELSGGMAQRITFILAVLKEPEFLILDEPTSGIDAETILLIKDFLKSYINEGDRAVLIITQDLSFVQGLTNLISFLSKNGISEFVTFEHFVNSFTDENAQVFINAYKELNDE